VSLDGEESAASSQQSVESYVVVRHSHWYNEIVSRICCLARKATTVRTDPAKARRPGYIFV
jgi:hypothetical protein